MQREFGLHELAVEDAEHGHQRPKIEEYGDSLFAVVHTVEPIDGELVVGELDIFVEENYVLTVRTHSEHSLLDVRKRCEREPHLLRQGSAFVFYALLDAVVDRYFPVIEELESELETVEEQIFTKGLQRSNIERLYQLKRKVTVLKHAVTPLMEAVAKLHGGRVPRICVQTQEYFRDVYDHLYRMNTTVDAIRDTIATAIQVNLSMVTIDQTEVSKRLAAWAAIFAVATAFVGVWGMNFEVMPELKWKYGYPAAVCLVAGVCGYLYWRFRKAGWL
jgi:magnesium transporter